MEPDREENIRMRAYEIWEREGRKEGGHEVHWHQAERELRDEQSGSDNLDESGDDAVAATPAADGAAERDHNRAVRCPRPCHQAALSVSPRAGEARQERCPKE